MPELEKKAWFHLVVALFTVLVWLAVFIILRNEGVAMASFALMSLTALPKMNPPRDRYDERDRWIAERSIGVALRITMMAVIALPVVTAGIFGWEHQFPLTSFATLVWFACLSIIAVQAIASIVMYRSGRHA